MWLSIHEHDLSDYTSLNQHLLSLSCLNQRKSLRDNWLELLFFEEVKQSNQVLSKPFRL